MYPKSLLPTSYNKTGVIVEAGFQHVSSRMISTYQSVIAAFAQVDVNPGALTNDDVSIQAKLAVWGVQTSPTMVAFKDGNHNNKLDLSLDDEGLIVDPADHVSFLGLAEAYQVTVFDARYKTSEYNESVIFHGQGITIENLEVNETEYYDGWSTLGTIGYDPQGSISSNFGWTAPVKQTDGTIVFAFGVDYTNFPVAWIDVNDTRNSFIEPSNIGYHYKVTVDPKSGKARISTTWTFDGITDATNNAKMDKLSLAVIIKSEFFALRVAYTATETNKTIDNSRSRSFGRLGIAFGGGTSTEIDVTGPKASYLLNGTKTVSASFDAINLLKVSGHFRAEKVSPFESESENTAGSANVGGIVERLAIDFFYSANLVIISYPKWSGDSIVHDPDYNVNYEPKAVTPTDPTSSDPTSDKTGSSEQPTSSVTSSSSTSKETDITTPDKKTTKTSGDAPLPGFTIVAVLSTLMIIPIINRKRK